MPPPTIGPDSAGTTLPTLQTHFSPGGPLWEEATSKGCTTVRSSPSTVSLLQVTVEMGCQVPTGTGYSQSSR